METTEKYIKALYDAGYNHRQIANALFKERKLLGTPTTEHECLLDTEKALLELHRRR